MMVLMVLKLVLRISWVLFVATAKKNNMRIIAVVMGEPDSQTRNKVSEMLDYALFNMALNNFLKQYYWSKRS